MKLGFIGVGAMGGAIMRGVLSSGIARPHDIAFSVQHTNKGTALAQELGISFIANNAQLVSTLSAQTETINSANEKEATAATSTASNNGCSTANNKPPHENADTSVTRHRPIIILGVKPYAIAGVCADIRDIAQQTGALIVSIAAGTTLAALESHFAQGQPIVRAMPNVPAQIRSGITALCANHAASADDLSAVQSIFEAVGETLTIEEKDFSAFTAIAGSSPAWTFQYIDSLARAALAAGMNKDAALYAASTTVLGSAQLALNALANGVKPQALIDTVTSPGGTTVAGLIAAEQAGFSTAAIAAVQACIARDKEMGA